ncbi:MAG: hypothetical protein ACFWUC_09950 [Oscillospiraceae bacterium]|jgi:hypothetical protein
MARLISNRRERAGNFYSAFRSSMASGHAVHPGKDIPTVDYVPPVLSIIQEKTFILPLSITVKK